MSDSTSFSHICSRALSRPVFTALAKGADPLKILAPLLEQLAEREVRSVAGALELAFSHLSSHHRNEYVYKSAVIDRIVFGRHSPANSAVGMELHVGKSIVDIAVFNGTSTAYEVKSELDSPRRLTSQTTDYLKAFDKVYVVSPRNNAHRYESFCDQRVGIMELNERGSLSTVREAASNIHNVDTRALFRMLRRDEYVGAIEKHLGQKISLPNGLVSQYCEKEFCKLSVEDAHAIHLKAMRGRTTNKEFVSYLRALPNHLRALGYSSNLSSTQRSKIREVLDSHAQLT
ncbi:sce7726 family protein [Stenotrophomonas sp. HMWF003]|uniref:sce7726 family protein n=1 Tax=Stenotrophomonas sp. HMWF003 TaxID=2056840 RepID=UPI000FE1E5E7|nr:sce7726 family protein [Stenotrophomonas sp. HMWF003]